MLNVFNLASDGVYCSNENGEIWVCKPVEVKGVTSDCNNSEESVILEVNGKLVKLKKSQLGHNTIFKELNNLGVDVAEYNAILLHEYIFSEILQHAATATHNKLGFENIESYSKYYLSNIISNNKDDESIYIGSKNIEPNGDKFVWDNLYNENITTCPYLQLLASLSMTAPLVSKLKAVSGVDNMLVSFVGESSTGKTTALKFAASLWGKPDVSSSGLISTFNATATAQKSMLADKIGFPTYIDESASLQANNWQSYIYDIMSGADKERANPDGSLRERRFWSTTIMITSERSILADVENEGANVRLIEIPFKFFDSADTAENVIEVVNQSYGHYGELFVKAVFKYDVFCFDWYKKCKKILRNRIDTKDGLRLRKMGMLAIILLAGYILRKAGLLAIDLKWLIEQLVELESKSAELATDKSTSALEYLQSFIASRTTLSNGVLVNNFVKIGWLDEKSGKCYLIKEEAKNILSKSLKSSELANIFSKWKANGIIENCDKGRYDTKRAPKWGGSKVRVMVFAKNTFQSSENTPLINKRYHLKRETNSNLLQDDFNDTPANAES